MYQFFGSVISDVMQYACSLFLFVGRLMFEFSTLAIYYSGAGRIIPDLFND